MQKKILPENATEVRVARLDFVNVELQYCKIGDSMGTNFEVVETHNG